MDIIIQIITVVITVFGGVLYMVIRLTRIEVLIKMHMEDHPCEAKRRDSFRGAKAGS